MASTVTLWCPLSRHAVARACDRHVRRLERGVVRGREPPVGRKALHLRVSQVAGDHGPHFVELSFRRLMPLDVAACQ
jgi:hypothetical protein